MAVPSNFDFLLPKWPAFHIEAKRVERDTLFDPLSTCIFGRRAIEVAIAWMHRADKSLVRPYKDDLNARIAAPTFTALVGQTIFTKMDLIRRLGNRAAHEGTKPPSSADALGVTRDLFHIMFWIASTYAPSPADQPSDSLAFDKRLLPHCRPNWRRQTPRSPRPKNIRPISIRESRRCGPKLPPPRPPIPLSRTPTTTTRDRPVIATSTCCSASPAGY